MNEEEKIAYEVSDESSLSEAEQDDQKKARKAILDRAAQTKQSEDKLKESMEEARKVMSESSWMQLQESQDLWQKQGRGRDINALVKDGISAAAAFAEAGNRRAQWITLHASWAMLIDNPGTFGGFYRSISERTVEIYEMPGMQLNLVLRVSEDRFVFTATGTTEAGSDSVRLVSERDASAAVRLERTETGNLEINLEPSFAASQISQSGMLIEGQYQRVKPGEINVFAPSVQ